MKVAVSGTHCCGKSTLIEEFLLKHPDFAHEPEPYTVLEEDYGEVFAAEPTADDFYRQLDFNVDQLRRYAANQRVIYERSPADFLAYMLALYDLGREPQARGLVVSALGIARDAIQLLDLIVFLPLNDNDHSVPPHLEDPELRRAVDCRLAEILNNDDLELLAADRPKVLDARGSTAERLLTIERWLGEQQLVEPR